MRIFGLRLLSLFLVLSLSQSLFASEGFKIRVKVSDYKSDTLVLGFHYGEKQYVKDTVTLGKDGYFTFEADTLLPCGVYLLVMQPTNDFVQFLLPEYDQDITLAFTYDKTVETMKVKGSEDNQIFYDYMSYLGKIRPEADTIRAQYLRLKENPADSMRLQAALDKMDQSVKVYQADLVKKYDKLLVSKIIKAAIEPTIPEFEGDQKQQQLSRYLWFRDHYFDNIEIENPCMLRTPVIHGKIDYFVNKLSPQHPDSISQTLDVLFKKLENTPETYKYYLIHYLNEYAKSKIVGFDACYVHLAKNYYCNGKAPWTTKEDLDKICENADRLEPILIGKKAPDIMMQTLDDKPMNLYGVQSPYTVLMFWAPDCGHCKKSAPDVVAFYEKYKGSGKVKIFAVCTAVTDKAAECPTFVEEKGFSDFINVTDPYIRSHYKTLYDVRSTPQIFILDADKTILMKRIGAEQLDTVFEDIMRIDDLKKADGVK